MLAWCASCYCARVHIPLGYAIASMTVSKITFMYGPLGCACYVKLNSYLNASIFLSLCCMRISIFWGHERLADRSISKRYPKSNTALWVEKKSTSRAFFMLVTQDSIGHLKTLCMSVLSLAVAFESEWKRYSSSQSDKKNARVRVRIQLYGISFIHDCFLSWFRRSAIYGIPRGMKSTEREPYHSLRLMEEKTRYVE